MVYKDEILESIETRDGWIIIKLSDEEPEHWAHIEGELEIALDKQYIPTKIEIEIKDTMESEKVLKNARLLSKNKIKIGHFEVESDEDGWIIIKLSDEEPEHWAHIEGELEIALDKQYIPTKIEIEIKDTMESEKVLKNAHLLTPRET